MKSDTALPDFIFQFTVHNPNMLTNGKIQSHNDIFCTTVWKFTVLI